MGFMPNIIMANPVSQSHCLHLVFLSDMVSHPDSYKLKLSSLIYHIIYTDETIAYPPASSSAH